MVLYSEARVIMKKQLKDITEIQAEFFLDITKDVCPITFVRTKLLLEKIGPNKTVQVRLKGAEPLKNVPQSVRELGHTVELITPEQPSESSDDIHLLFITTKS